MAGAVTDFDVVIQEDPPPREKVLEPAETAAALADRLWMIVRNREAGSELNAESYVRRFTDAIKSALDVEVAKTDAAAATLEQAMQRLNLAVRKLTAIRIMARRTPESPHAVLAAAKAIKLEELRMPK